MVTAQDVRAVALALPRTEEHLIRDHVKFRVGKIVYVAISRASMSPGLTGTRSRSASMRMVALTNSTQPVAEAQLTGAGLGQHFEAVISADSVRHLKPAPQPYHAVAEHTGVGLGDVRLVAAHSWDISGALSAGCQAAFVARPGMVLSPLSDQPDIIGPDLAAVVGQIIATDG
jgi:2-haloacid dehalogenase